MNKIVKIKMKCSRYAYLISLLFKKIEKMKLIFSIELFIILVILVILVILILLTIFIILLILPHFVLLMDTLIYYYPFLVIKTFLITLIDLHSLPLPL